MVADDMKNLKIGVIGAGIMGRALINGMLAADLLDRRNIHASVHTVKSKEAVIATLGVDTTCGYPADKVAETDVFLICTKPYRVVEVLEDLKASGRLRDDAPVISIAAGTTVATMEDILPRSPVIRAMPNTPSRIGAGVTVISPGRHTKPEHMALAQRIFSSVGLCLELDETHLNAVTAVSGAGPAYIFLIIESLADGAVRVGLPRDTAFQLVAQTVLGAARMMLDSGKHPAMLKDEVTTPSGCTIGALLTMEDGKIRSTLARAVEEATDIAGKLG
ncbi:MAG: pyrroline-5-carboxylate reductase [Acidobacteriota bacterium]|nr:pyrroline-5-carboxylate reductase [Acidobacteriota bacterium]